MMLGILDYGMGNLRSVQKAIQRVGSDAMIVSTPAEIKTLDKLILPGVGAFTDGMANIRQMDLEEAIPGISSKVTLLDRPYMDVTATAIRSRVAHGQVISDLVPAPVEEYISLHSLYSKTRSI